MLPSLSLSLQLSFLAFTSVNSRQVEGLRVTVWVDRIHCLPWAGGSQMTAGASVMCVPHTLVYRCYIQKAPLSISLVCSPWGDQCRPRRKKKTQHRASKAEVWVTAKSTPRLDLHWSSWCPIPICCQNLTPGVRLLSKTTHICVFTCFSFAYTWNNLHE